MDSITTAVQWQTNRRAVARTGHRCLRGGIDTGGGLRRCRVGHDDRADEVGVIDTAVREGTHSIEGELPRGSRIERQTRIEVRNPRHKLQIAGNGVWKRIKVQRPDNSRTHLHECGDAGRR